MIPSLLGQEIVLYDLESRHLVGEIVDGIEVTWDNLSVMGISSGVSYSCKDGTFHLYMEDNMGKLVERLNGARMIGGFNHVGFDNNLLRSCGYPLKDDRYLNNYDLFIEAALDRGWDTKSPLEPFHKKGITMGEILENSGLAVKRGKATDAPGLFRSKKFGTLLDYNLGDGVGLRDLFEAVWYTGIAHSANRNPVTFRSPYEFYREGPTRPRIGYLV